MKSYKDIVSEDKYQWLEEVESEKSLEWVKSRNDKTLNILENDSFYKEHFSQILEMYESKEKLETPMIKGEYIYNYWQDDRHVRGILRRCQIEEFFEENIKWENVFDLDQFSLNQNKNYVYKGIDFNFDYTKGILYLSDGGKDATEKREFDLVKKEFIENGFFVPESKGNSTYINDDLWLLSSDFGDDTLTNSGYPKQIKIVDRTNDHLSKDILLEISKEDMGIWSYNLISTEKRMQVIEHRYDFYTTEFYYLTKELKHKKIPIPNHADIIGLYKNYIIFSINKNWDQFIMGSYLAINVDQEGLEVIKVFTPTKSEFAENLKVTKNEIILQTLNEVKPRLYSLKIENQKIESEVISFEEEGMISSIITSSQKSDFFITHSSALSPLTLYCFKEDKGRFSKTKVKENKHHFDSENLQIQQKFATSNDGTKISYFIISNKDIDYNEKNPTILYGYGGFRIPILPYYNFTMGKMWLEKGGVYVYANIRGGGEYGPQWHESALKKNRLKCYEDFSSVAKDLIKNKLTSSKNLGIYGGSNGGLLVGATMVLYPTLFQAVACAVPLLDMVRFHKLLAGASWMGEYGDPEVDDEREYILKYSPYQNLKKDQQYPQIFLTTSTKDDRVHPAHARKMAAKMEEFGHQYFYYENIDGGHSAAANLKESARYGSLIFTYFHKMLFS